MNPFKEKPQAIAATYESFPALYPRSYDPKTADPYTKCRIILMNGTEFEAVKFSHQMARHVENQALRRELAMTRRTEQQQREQLVVNTGLEEHFQRVHHAGVGHIAKDAAKAHRQQERRLHFLDDRQIDHRSADDPHDDHREGEIGKITENLSHCHFPPFQHRERYTYSIIISSFDIYDK